MQGVHRRSTRLYSLPIQVLKDELALPCPRPPELLEACRGVCQWARTEEHTWERVEATLAIPTLVCAVDHLQCWPSGMVEDPEEGTRMMQDLSGGEGGTQPGVLHVLMALAGPVAQAQLRAEYRSFFRIVAHELGELSSSSSDSSNPRDHWRLYQDLEERSTASSDSSNPRGLPGAWEGRRLAGVPEDHQSLVALTEYAHLLEYVCSQPNGASVLSGFRRCLRSQRIRGEYPFHPLPEGLVEERFHARRAEGFSGGNVEGGTG